MLLTETNLARRRSLLFPQPERQYKVKKSMGAIKHVLGERKRAAIAAHKAKVQEAAAVAVTNNNDMMPVFDFHEKGNEFDDELGGDEYVEDEKDEGEGALMEDDDDDEEEDDDMDDDDYDYDNDDGDDNKDKKTD